MTPTSGFIIFDKLSIWPFLSIPTSKIPKSSFVFRLNKLRGTPNLLLKDFGEYVTWKILFNDFPVNSFKEVFPQLPVMAIILLDKFSLKIEDAFVKKFKLSFTIIFFLIFSPHLLSLNKHH